MKSILLSGVILLGGATMAQAAEQVSQTAFVKGMKAYQSYIVAKADTERPDVSSDSAPAAVEPALGFENGGSENGKDEIEIAPPEQER